MTNVSAAAEAGRRLAREHRKTHPLQPWQIEAAARILATVEPGTGRPWPEADPDD